MGSAAKSEHFLFSCRARTGRPSALVLGLPLSSDFSIWVTTVMTVAACLGYMISTNSPMPSCSGCSQPRDQTYAEESRTFEDIHPAYLRTGHAHTCDCTRGSLGGLRGAARGRWPADALIALSLPGTITFGEWSTAIAQASAT